MRALSRLLILLSLACAGCGPTVDLTKGLQVVDVTTGLFDLGVVNGQNKLVPTVKFKLKNVSDQKLVALQVNAVFKKVNDLANEWGSQYIIVAQSEGLAPGATTKEWTIQSPLGYTGLQPRADMMTHKDFIDSKVELFAKYAAVQWARVGDYPIDRRLLTR